MTGIVEFLTARLDEEQQLADASRSTLLIANLDRCKVPGSAEEATFRHHERWEPYRVLADVAAKRRIIAACDYDGMTAEYVLQCLAQPYAGHPDFDPSWGQQ